MEVRNEGIEKRLFETLTATLEPQRLELWFKNSCLSFDGTKLVVGVQTPFAVNFVRANFLKELEQICVAVLGKPYPVEIAFRQKEPSPTPVAASQLTPVPTPHLVAKRSGVPALCGSGTPHGALPVADNPVPFPPTTLLRPGGPLKSLPQDKLGGRRFASLQNYVEGISNRLACKAADLAVKHPGQINPIYIFGPSSVGKTHLLEGIWAAFRRLPNPKPPLSPRKPPLYLTAEQFISSFQASIQQKTIAGFRDRFKGISILLIDDIQYLSGKSVTQTEFMNIIDTLRVQGVQLVFSGDRPVRDLTGFQNELTGRLEAGMACPIEQPEREMMLQIFRNMAIQRQLPMGEDVCRFVASRLNAHVRQLSGAMNRLHVAYLTNGEPITLAVAEETLDDLIRNNHRSIRLQEIGKAVCQTFGLSEDSLQARNQTKQVSAARMLAMWLARKYTRSALSEIGKFFGGRTHSTVSNTLKKVDAWIDEKNPVHSETFDLPLADAIRKIERILQVG